MAPVGDGAVVALLRSHVHALPRIHVGALAVVPVVVPARNPAALVVAVAVPVRRPAALQPDVVPLRRTLPAPPRPDPVVAVPRPLAVHPDVPVARSHSDVLVVGRRWPRRRVRDVAVVAGVYAVGRAAGRIGRVTDL